MSSSASRSRHQVAGLTVLATAAAVVALTLVAWLVAPDHNPSGQCEGIGWGCTLSPRDSIVFAAVLLGAPVGLGTLIVASVFLAIAERRRWWPGMRGVPLGLLAVVVGVLGCLVIGATLIGLGTLL